MEDLLAQIFGLDTEQLSALQVLARVAVVYPLAIAFVRLGDKRFIGKFTAFDVIIGITMGSILSRAIGRPHGFIPNLTAAAALVAFHYLFATLAYHSDRFATLIKGHPRILVRDGEIDWKSMRTSRLTEEDLRSLLRQNADTDDLGSIRIARLEPSGNISFIPKDG